MRNCTEIYMHVYMKFIRVKNKRINASSMKRNKEEKDKEMYREKKQEGKIFRI